MKVPRKQKRFVREHNLPKTILIRCVKIPLDTGEIELLATSLLSDEYHQEEFGWVYHKRWGIETYIDRLKNIFEVERFSGQSVQSIQQDFHGIVFLANLESILSKSDDKQLSKQTQIRQKKHTYQVNHSVSYSTLVDYITQLLMDKQKSVSQTLDEIHFFFQKNPCAIRNGRKLPRIKLYPSKKLRFYRYTKKIRA